VVAGIWCLAAFVLSQAYNSTLITYVIAPNNRPLINSVLDIVNDPKIHLVVEKNMGLDVVISVWFIIIITLVFNEYYDQY
jgi:hypothetical protein